MIDVLDAPDSGLSDDLSPKQVDFLRNSTTKVSVLEGSIRSGKTIVSLMRWLIFIARSPKDGELVMIGRTRDAVWRNCIGPLQSAELFGALSNLVVGNYGAPTIKIFGRLVHIMGAHDKKAEKSIRGMTIGGAYIDEITTLPEEFFTQLLGRLSPPGSKLFGTTNPDNPSHWFKLNYLDRLDELTHWRHWHFVMDDNPSLTASYKAQKALEFTGLWYKRFILGEWVAAEGAIYDMWDPDRHVVPWENLPRMLELYGVGVDYGTTNPTAAVLLGRGVDGCLYLIDEWVWSSKIEKKQLTDAQQATKLLEWQRQDHLPYRHHLNPRWIMLDPAAVSFRIELNQQGATGLTQANNDVAYGIRTVATLLGAGKLKISSRCKTFIREAPGYAWDPKETEKGKDAPLKVADHALDAGRYVIVSTETLWRQHLEIAA